MEIIIGKTAGFCFGVANAVNKTKKVLESNEELYCLGELIHNRQVINDLAKDGLITIEDIKQAKENVIIRAHGEKKETYEIAKRLGINVIDLTCPKVLNIHKMAENYANNGYYIFLIGSKKHPEIIGTISYCGKNSTIIESKEDIKIGLKSLEDSRIKKLVILEQTTFGLEKFNELIKIISEKLKDKQINI